MKTALAFAAAAATVAVAAASPGQPIWSRPAQYFPEPIVFGDGTAVVTTTATSVVSYDQATGATHGTFQIGPGLAITECAVPRLTLAFLPSGSMVPLEGKNLTQLYTTPALEFLDLCGADKHVALLSGKNPTTGLWEIQVIDLATGVLLRTVPLPEAKAGDVNAQCTFLGDHVFSEPLGLRAGNAAKHGKRFHKGQRPQRVHRVEAEAEGAAAPATGAFFIRTNSTVMRFDYTAPGGSGTVTGIKRAWMVPFYSGGESFLITADQSTLVVGFRTAIDTKAGNVRTAGNLPQGVAPLFSIMYRGSTALLSLVSGANDIVVYDFATLQVVKTVQAAWKNADCDRPFTTLDLQPLPKSNLLMATNMMGCALAFEYTLSSTLPIGELPPGTHLGFLDSLGTPGAVLAYGAVVGRSVLELVSTSTWKPVWSVRLANSTGDGGTVGPQGRRIFVDSTDTITAYSL